ncbi:MAG TPA: helix-turn-helix domain-containing protein [Candidatus Baltobacteraceae bacterium]|jgi:AraC-like DNA-binding protein|nr:helix-turn-helix domain-containing protein [Candidatus Baltobacteraceae bacterium]
MTDAAIQLAPGLFGFENARAHLGHVQFDQTIYHVSARDAIGTSPGTLAFGFLHRQGGPARINGRLWLNHRLAVILGRAEFSTMGPAVLLRMEVDIARVPILGELIGMPQADGQWLAILPPKSTVARRLECRIADCVASRPASTHDCAFMQRTIALAFRATELALQPEHQIPLDANRQEMVDAAEAYLWSNISGPIGLADLSRGIGCSARSLSDYYRKLYGISPIHYLKMLRLNRAREELSRNGSAGKTVSEIAADHGFWHMGHFSNYYRYLFGETASETLRRAGSKNAKER